MGLLDNIDEELKKIQSVRESQKVFHKTKLKNIEASNKKKKLPSNPRVRLPKSFYKKIKKPRNKVGKKREKLIKEGSNRKYANRCPKQYDIYITSHWWIKRKNLYYKTHKRECVACGSTEHINLHHLVYKDFGKELDKNLKPLCRVCHEEFHSIYGVKNDLYKETMQFIEDKKHPN